MNNSIKQIKKLTPHYIKYINLYKIYYKKNKKKILIKIKKFQQKNKNKIRDYHKQYYLKNKERLIQYAKNYDLRNHKTMMKNHRIYVNRKRKLNINFKILCNLGNRIWHALKRNIKSIRTVKLLGCSINKLKKHLESQFKEGMTWKNYGRWHVDHIKPCASFDLSKPSEQKKCFNYKNLQPLWAKENLRKSSII